MVYRNKGGTCKADVKSSLLQAASDVPHRLRSEHGKCARATLPWPGTTMAAIDRVVHHSVILDLMGMDSYRAREATLQHAPPLPPESGLDSDSGIGEAA